MAFTYEKSIPLGALRQGEILQGISEHVVRQPPIALPEDSPIMADSVIRPLMVIMSPDCDLEQDFNARYPDQAAKAKFVSPAEIPDPHIVHHVILCDVYERPDIRDRFRDKDLFKRVWQNENERYHFFPKAFADGDVEHPIPEIFLDFRKMIGIPAPRIYEGIMTGGIRRLAIVPPIYVQHLSNRFYGFQSRVALPDPLPDTSQSLQ